MTEVATCPTCEGERRKYSKRSGRYEECPTCVGAGVVWLKEASPDDPPGADELDLTYHRS